MIGADPAAWSIFNLIKIKGTKKPSKDATVIVAKRAKPTAKPNIGKPSHMVAISPP